MRTTLRIDDDLHRELRERATAQGVSISELFNRTLRLGLAAKPPRARRYRQRVYNLGEPRFNVDKALAFASDLEDEEILRKLAIGK